MDTKDEYLCYTNQNNTTFYFKNRKLHRSDGPAILSPRDRKNYEGIKDSVLYVESKDEVEPNHQKDVLLFYCHYTHSYFYLEGVRYNSQKEMDSFSLHEELNNDLKNKTTDTTSKNSRHKL